MTGRALRDEFESGPRALARSRWDHLRPRPVPVAELYPTQWPHYGVCQLCTLRLGRPVEGGDPYPHVVEWKGRRYIWDGHTRIARALREGQATIAARVLALS